MQIYLVVDSLVSNTLRSVNLLRIPMYIGTHLKHGVLPARESGIAHGGSLYCRVTIDI